MQAQYDEKGRRSLKPTGGPEVIHECDEVLIAVGQENAFPWIERDSGIAFDEWGMPVLDKTTLQSSIPNVFFGGDSALGPKNIIWAVAHGHDAAISIDKLLHGEDVRDRPAPGVTLLSQKMGIHEWSYDNEVANDERYKVPWRDVNQVLRNIKVEVELGFDPATAWKEAQRCLNCDVQTVFTAQLCIECDACVDICPTDCINFIVNGEEAESAAKVAGAGAESRTRSVCGRRVEDRARDGQGRGRVPALRPMRRTMPDRRVGHAEVSARNDAGGTRLSAAAEGGGMNAPDRAAAASPTRTSRIQAVNDFVIKFANVNGSGSASANELFARSILRMGVPVSPRNIFPSNIQGLPTWYEVRVTEQGHLGRRGGVDLMVAMNPQTWEKDIAEIEPGGYLMYDSTKPLAAAKLRADVNLIGVPLTDIAAANTSTPKSGSC